MAVGKCEGRGDGEEDHLQGSLSFDDEVCAVAAEFGPEGLRECTFLEGNSCVSVLQLQDVVMPKSAAKEVQGVSSRLIFFLRDVC